MALGVALAYLVIVSAVPLLHKEDCPAAPGNKTTEDSLPSGAPCPACMFLANSNAAQVHCDCLPGLTQSPILAEFTQDFVVVVVSSCAGPILLRGPPAYLLS